MARIATNFSSIRANSCHSWQIFCHMSKTLCNLKRELKKDMATYVLLVNQPKFVCTACGRVANKKKNLCQPEKIKNLLTD